MTTRTLQVPCMTAKRARVSATVCGLATRAFTASSWLRLFRSHKAETSSRENSLEDVTWEWHPMSDDGSHLTLTGRDYGAQRFRWPVSRCFLQQLSRLSLGLV